MACAGSIGGNSEGLIEIKFGLDRYDVGGAVVAYGVYLL
jgi:hypothetical protein